MFADTLDVRGTAFWLKEHKVLITCAHVVQDLVVTPIEIAGLLVVGNQGNYTRAVVGALDFDHDLAALYLAPETPAEFQQRELADGLDLAAASPVVGCPVAYAGFPFGTQLLSTSHAPTYAEGVVASEIRTQPRRKQIQISGATAGGFSGAPIVDRNNPTQVVAVLSNSPSREAGQAAIFMGISWEHIKALASLATS